ncbi:MAG: AAA family ATPase [Spirochaetes bacterium]|nr:AAA family ATPase [Spirochaetota bacterium]
MTTLRECGNQMVSLAEEIGKELFNIEDTIKMAVLTIFASPDGRYSHFLLEAPPGMGKTVLCKTIAKWCSLTFKRIQLTPDMQPSEIVMTQELEMSGGGMRTKQVFGPIFTNILLADEINRTPPRTQSSILQPMAECETTYGGKTFHLGHVMSELDRYRGDEYNERIKAMYDKGPWTKPAASALFYVFATQNPIENEGTYRLPEAQLDRFLFKMDLDYPEELTIREILKRKAAIGQFIRSYYDAMGDSSPAVRRVEELREDSGGDFADLLKRISDGLQAELAPQLKKMYDIDVRDGKEAGAVADELKKLLYDKKDFLKKLDKKGSLDPGKVIDIRRSIALKVGVSSPVYYEYVSHIIERIRTSGDFAMKVSPRVCDTVLSVAKAHCVFRVFMEARRKSDDGYDPETLFITKEDINACARNMLPHRVSLSYETQAKGYTTRVLVENILRSARNDPRFSGIE